MGIWGTTCVACQMWHDGVHGPSKAPASCTCVSTHHPSLPLAPQERFWAETLFLPFIAPVSNGDEGRQVLRRHSKRTTPSQPDSQLSFIPYFSSILVRAAARPWSDLDTRS